MAKPESYQVDQIEMGFSMDTVRIRPFVNLHCHNEIEIGISLQGTQTAIVGQHLVEVPPNRLGVFWANRPHGPVKVEPGHSIISLRIPFPWFLNWDLPKPFVDVILQGELIRARMQAEPCSDVNLMQHWLRLMTIGSDETRKIVLLEVEARLRRLAFDHASELRLQPGVAKAPTVHWSTYEKMVVFLAKKYREQLTVADVARAVGLHRVYAMRLFRKMSGTTIQQCIIRYRVSHAQRLLAATKKKVLTVALESGFNSATQFYTFFHRIVGQTPQKYRLSLRRGKLKGTPPHD